MADVSGMSDLLAVFRAVWAALRAREGLGLVRRAQPECRESGSSPQSWHSVGGRAGGGTLAFSHRTKYAWTSLSCVVEQDVEGRDSSRSPSCDAQL